MGSFIRRQITPNDHSASPERGTSLLEWRGVVSRANFTFLYILDIYGAEEESILWLACNVANSGERYFVRQISKYKVYDHKKITPTLNELAVLSQNGCPYLIKVCFAFQDYESLYLVSQAMQSQSLEVVMQHHQFTESETRYIVIALLSVIEYVHNAGFAITSLSPKDIHINRQGGSIKIVRISNPTPIDSYCSSNAVEQVCPYSAPQILLRERVLAECDFYSVGLIAYELMTLERALAIPAESYSRSSILKENVEVEKSKVPEEWHPDVADFLKKLLIKNPALRLGRYGSYEVKNHAWLREFDMAHAQSIRLATHQAEAPQSRFDYILQERDTSEGLSQECIRSHFFQELFEKYKFQRREGQCETLQEEGQECEQAIERSSIHFNDSKVNLRK